MEQPIQLIQITQQIFRALRDHAVLRELNAAGGAVQQLRAQMIFQSLDLARYATFRKSEGVCGTRKALQFATRMNNCIA